jgi:hypothetical protein
MIGTMLTALVVSREWERGTMGMLATPTNHGELILSKLLPYFFLAGWLVRVAPYSGPCWCPHGRFLGA